MKECILLLSYGLAVARMAQHSKNAWSGIGYLNNHYAKGGSFAQYVGSQLSVESALYGFIAALLSQAELPGGSMPFCVPFVAALLLLQKPSLTSLAGCAIGLLLRWEPISWINGWQLAGCALLALIVRKGWDWKPWKVSVAAAAVLLLPAPFVISRMDMLIACLSGGAAAGLMTPVCIRALLAVSMPKQALTNDDKLCCLLLAGAIGLGGLWIGVGRISLGIALISVLILVVAWAAGAGLSLPAGVLMGLIVMTSGMPLSMVMLLAVLGGLAGLLRGSSRVLALSCGLLGCALVAYAEGGVELIISGIPSIAVGGFLFLMLPTRRLDAVCGLLEPSYYAANGPDAAVPSHVLSGYAEAMAGMAQALPMPETTSDMQPVELLACRLCTGCENQQICWDERRKETMELLDGILLACSGEANALEIEEAARMSGCARAPEVFGLSKGLLSSRLRKEKEDARRMEARAWALEQLRGQARALSSLAEQMSDGSGEAERARAALCAAMPALRGRPDAISLSMLGGKLHLWLDVRSSGGQVERLTAAVGAALSRRMELLESQSRHDTLLFVEKPKLKLSVGRSSMPIDGEEISGDSTLSERLDASRHLLAISDGMGSGREARSESRAALDLLLQALRAGYGRGDALRTVNGLLVACRGDEMFATMDLCVVDLDSGEAALDKMGACPSFLIRGGKCKRIGSDTLPMGILDAVKPRAIAIRMQPGDTLLMISDGVSDAFGADEGALLRALGGLVTGERLPTPQKFADTLLRRAYERSGQAALDDMTVMVARLEQD